MTEIVQLMDAIMLGECPRWHDGKLWFADWVAQKLYTIDANGRAAVEAQVASLPFSFDWLADGRMLLVHAADNDLKLRQADGSFSRFADLFASVALWLQRNHRASGRPYLRQQCQF